MKTLLTAACAAALTLTPPLILAAPETDEERLSYSLGVAYGQSIAQDFIDLDVDAFAEAVRDVIEGNDLAMSNDEMAKALSRFQEEAMAARQDDTQELAELNLAEGAAFLEENAEREGIEVTESGLQYEVLEAGDGPSPDAASTVEVHYEGSLVDGTVFDSSYDRGEPLTLRVNQVIEGWREALQLMQVGATWKLYIPAELGYGAQGQGPIGPNETLIFEVELLDVLD